VKKLSRDPQTNVRKSHNLNKEEQDKRVTMRWGPARLAAAYSEKLTATGTLCTRQTVRPRVVVGGGMATVIGGYISEISGHGLDSESNMSRL
jgi:hypothetical protein